MTVRLARICSRLRGNVAFDRRGGAGTRKGRGRWGKAFLHVLGRGKIVVPDSGCSLTRQSRNQRGQ